MPQTQHQQHPQQLAVGYYFVQPQHQLLLMSHSAQQLHALDTTQRTVTPQQWLACYCRADQQKLLLAMQVVASLPQGQAIQCLLKLGSPSKGDLGMHLQHQLWRYDLNGIAMIIGAVSPCYYSSLSS
ncbi:hypothetical protein CWI84_10055 [Idiomarina tyrosinivorans]|uniref:Uncharacterized protein n=1 Tax=Idiomarina tyrosinivorans TaxID=1445662 RepID=A0A432ZLP8_9GAMM|nr:hypothetical protein [Idiomarina tyrosinivorans]RUO78888.1 hypothetical protein CWI84_10055 [Idiomarina tyrosinivorans]